MSVRSLSNSVHNAFATKHLFRDCFPRNFKYRLFQRKRTLPRVWLIKHEGTRGAFWFACRLPVVGLIEFAHFGLRLRVDKSLLTTPGRANYSCPTYHANCESVLWLYVTGHVSLNVRIKVEKKKNITPHILSLGRLWWNQSEYLHEQARRNHSVSHAVVRIFCPVVLLSCPWRILERDAG